MSYYLLRGHIIFLKLVINLKLVVATKNKGKLSEIKAILSGLDLEIVSQDEAGIDIEVEETGDTFLQNAILKASAIAAISNEATIADDSGLCVDYLNGEPGVYSKRYAGEGATDGQCIEKLLGNMQNADDEDRGAHFISVVTLYMPDGRYYSAEGKVDGKITKQPCGDNGFGYDPVFFSNELGKTFAQASDEEKNQISHRARALAALKDSIKYMLSN